MYCRRILCIVDVFYVLWTYITYCNEWMGEEGGNELVGQSVAASCHPWQEVKRS